MITGTLGVDKAPNYREDDSGVQGEQNLPHYGNHIDLVPGMVCCTVVQS